MNGGHLGEQVSEHEDFHLNIKCNTNIKMAYWADFAELPRPLLKYARQASLVEQPTLPELGLQYCFSWCA